MSVTLKTDLTGEQELLRKFDNLGKKAGKKVLRKATRAGAAPLVKASKRNAPKDKGDLKKDLVQKQKFYANTGTQVAIIGAKKRKDGKSRSTWILHLVEEGTTAHVISPKNKKALALGAQDAAPDGSEEAKIHVYRKVRHPGNSGSHFLRRSAEQAQGESTKRFSEKMATEVEIEAKKS